MCFNFRLDVQLPALGMNPQLVEFRDEFVNRGIGIAEEDRSTDADESPTKSFKNCLPFHVLR